MFSFSFLPLLYSFSLLFACFQRIDGNIVKTRSFGSREKEAFFNLSVKVLKSQATGAEPLKDSYYAVKLLKESSSKANTEKENKDLLTKVCENADSKLRSVDSKAKGIVTLSDIAYSTLIVAEFEECKEINPLVESSIKSIVKNEILPRMDSGSFTQRYYAMLTATLLYTFETDDELKKKLETSMKKLLKFVNGNDGTVKEISSTSNVSSNTLNSYKLLDILNRVSPVLETSKSMKKAVEKMIQLLPSEDPSEDQSGKSTDPMVYPLLFSLLSPGNKDKGNGYSFDNRLENMTVLSTVASLLVDLLETDNIENAYKISNALLALPGKDIPVITCITPVITIEQSSLEFKVTDLYGDAFLDDKKVEVKAENFIRAPKATDDILGGAKVLYQDSKEKDTFTLKLNDITEFSAGIYIIKLLINDKYNARKLLQVMDTNTSLDDLCSLSLKMNGKTYSASNGENKANLLPQKTIEASLQEILRFKLTCMSTPPQQLVIKFSTKDNSIYYPLLRAKGRYELESSLHLGEQADLFDYNSGVYSVSIIVGDITWEPEEIYLGSFKIDFGPKPKESFALYEKPLLYHSDVSLEPMPIIEHQFRQPEKRASLIVSYFFTGINIFLTFIFLVSCLTIGQGNVKKVFDLDAFGKISGFFFFLCLGAFLFLYGMYWYMLRMITTLKIASGLSIMTLFSSHFLLTKLLNIAEEEKDGHNEDLHKAPLEKASTETSGQKQKNKKSKS